MHDRRFFLLAMGAALTAGCQSTWTKPPSEASILPPAVMSPDSVVLEVCTLRYSLDDASLVAEVWAASDESGLASDLRRELAENGFRAGILGQRTPPALEKLLASAAPSLPPREKKPETAAADQPVDAKTEPAAPPDTYAEIRPERIGKVEQRRIHCRTGQRAEVLTSGVRPKIALLKRVEGKLTGREFHEAQCVFVLLSQPLGDARVRLDVTPELQHGTPKQRFVGQQGVFALDHGRDRETFPDLRVTTHLAPGQTLVLASSAEPLGLGREFFHDASSQPPQAKLVLIRLAQTQYDDLFAPEKVQAPVTTLD